MGKVINLASERRKRSGELPPLGLLGSCASADSILRKSLAAVDPTERAALLQILARGSYRDMLVELTARFTIMNIGEARAVG